MSAPARRFGSRELSTAAPVRYRVLNSEFAGAQPSATALPETPPLPEIVKCELRRALIGIYNSARLEQIIVKSAFSAEVAAEARRAEAILLNLLKEPHPWAAIPGET